MAIVRIGIFLLELLVTKLFRTNTFLLLFTAVNTLNALCGLYTAFFSLGVLSYFFVCVAQMPYLFAVIRLVARKDSEYRRKCLYNVCYSLYWLQLSLDLWTMFNLTPAVDSICHFATLVREPVIVEAVEKIAHLFAPS